MKLLHLSDLHIQADVPLRPFGALDWRQLVARAEFVHQGRPALFRRAENTLGSLLREPAAASADHLLITGDLTAVGLREEHHRARQALSAFEGRLSVIPGNHDRTSRGSAENFESVFGDLLRSDLPELCAEGPYPFVHFIGERSAVIGLDSGRVPSVPGVARGWVGKAQLAALERILAHDRLRDRNVVIGVHHAPFAPNGGPDRRLHGLVDASELLAMADAHGVTSICHGHIHHRYRIDRVGRTPILCAGSSTQAGREGYWIVELPEGTQPREPVNAISRHSLSR